MVNTVFGVSKDLIGSYIEREDVDVALSNALDTTKQIVVYGSSKQGKTALLQRHVKDEDKVVYHCGPTSQAVDIYSSILRSYDIMISTSKTTALETEGKVSLAAKVVAKLPFIGSTELQSNGTARVSRETASEFRAIEFNLNIAQDIGELLLKVDGHKKYHILENFHYLTDVVQRQLAFDLRTFEEMGIRFIVLGVWREKNRLVQYNGDLQDRLAEVPVEPWKKEDFQRVIVKGENLLNLKFSDEIKNRILDEAHGSVAVVQELLKVTCEQAGVKEKADSLVEITDLNFLLSAIKYKVQEYSSRHVRSLESIATGSRTRKTTEETTALYLPYYVVRVLISLKYDELKEGIERSALQEQIRKIHPHPDNVRSSDITSTLNRLSALQSNLMITPPLFDYDRGIRRLKIVDSTLYFFIDNCDPEEVMSEIPNPNSKTSYDLFVDEVGSEDFC